ncbi:hypothetical protein POTOM_020190 [Populus tomentosa]|uniref:Uncharacterized protein n=1 Tax=Populus tomentosa TaxID=118781 RepID=A0A8X7ZX08_POPTO|nr:hypothetical protein POTOM_020190 [Populus tomentosa]
MAASEEWRGSQRPSLLTHYVNLRRKMEPKLSDNSMGNFLWLAAAKYTNKSKPGLKDLVGEVRKAISKIDSDFVEHVKGDKRNNQMDETLKGIGAFGSGDGVDYLGFSSWCKFGLYDIDFGWGKPVWLIHCMRIEGLCDPHNSSEVAILHLHRKYELPDAGGVIHSRAGYLDLKLGLLQSEKCSVQHLK